MAGKLNQDSDGAIAEINIVPFVDIILVVLIIFMVTTPFIMKPAIPVNLPKAASGEDATPSKLNLVIAASGELNLNGKTTTLSEISEAAKQAANSNPDTQAIVAADKEVPHGQVISVIDAIKSAGVTKFAITIDKK